jgi:hypothetical protein
MPGRRRRHTTRAFPPGGDREFAMIRLVTVILSPLAIWGCLALWYRAPGARALRIVAVTLWAAFSLAMLLALSSQRMAVAAGFRGGILRFTAVVAAPAAIERSCLGRRRRPDDQRQRRRQSSGAAKCT